MAEQLTRKQPTCTPNVRNVDIAKAQRVRSVLITIRCHPLKNVEHFIHRQRTEVSPPGVAGLFGPRPYLLLANVLACILTLLYGAPYGTGKTKR